TRCGSGGIDAATARTLVRGMFGSRAPRRYAILKQREASVFMWLHSIEDPSLAFPIVLPWVFYWDYEVDLSDADMAAIGVERADQISIYCVVDVGADVRAATINLFSPIVVNNGDHSARQVINARDCYWTPDSMFRENVSPTPVAMHESDAPNVTVLTTGG